MPPERMHEHDRCPHGVTRGDHVIREMSAPVIALDKQPRLQFLDSRRDTHRPVCGDIIHDVQMFDDLPPIGERPERLAVLHGHDVLIRCARDHEMFLMRTDDTYVPAWMRNVKENARERVALHAGLWDWDCHKCETSVMTPELSDVCPNCYL